MKTPGRVAVRTCGMLARRAACALALALLPVGAGAQGTSCEETAGFDRLDFWLGDWEVLVNGAPAGTNRIEKILSGCAVMEFWTGQGGSEGRSLFYREHGTGAWKQVWVTSLATQPGGLKEKALVEGPPGTVRFQGTITLPDGRTYLDRTTLTPVAEGRVRQVIEVSVDGGTTWTPRFDGLYVPARGAGRAGEYRQGEPLASYLAARRTVERALAAAGGAGAVERAGGLTLVGSGQWDLGIRLQGMRPFVPEPRPLVERLALAPAAGRVVYETRSPVNPDAAEWLRYDYRPEGAYIVDLLARRAFPGGGGDRSRLERTVPHRLLEEVLSAPGSLRDLGDGIRGPDGNRRGVVWTAPGGTVLTLQFDVETGVLREVSYVADMPVRGDAAITWRYAPWQPVEGLGAYPTGYTIDLEGEPVRTVRYERVAVGAAAGLLEEPADIRYPQPPASSAAASAPPPTEAESFDIRELAPGVFLLLNVRGGFHVLFVEFGEFVLAVDAPAGWLELQELPSVISFGPRGSIAVGERYARAIRSRIPDKPIRYIVLTHHHDDHAGGVRAFVEAGATVLASPVTRPVVEQALAGPHTLAGVPLGAAPPALRFEPVLGQRVLADDSMEVRLIDVGPNPHAEGMLAVFLPRQGILYVADLLEPGPDAALSSSARLPVMRWFVRWLDDSGLDPDRVYSVHGRPLATREQLDLIRSLPPDTAPTRPR